MLVLELGFSNSRIEALVAYAQPLTGWVFVNYGSKSHCNEESGWLFRQASPRVGLLSGRIAVRGQEPRSRRHCTFAGDGQRRGIGRRQHEHGPGQSVFPVGCRVRERGEHKG